MENIAVWFSCGAASAVAAKKTIELFDGLANIRILNNEIKEEDPDNRRFLLDVQDWLGVEIEDVFNPKYPSKSIEDVFKKRKYMSGIAGAPCTLELKKEARYFFERHNKIDWHVLGFTYEEKKRHENFIVSEKENVLPVLIDQKITKQMCYQIINDAGIKLPRVYSLGYPNANCIGCVKATSPTYWNHVRRNHPDVFKRRAAQSREIGAKLVRVKGKRLFLDELNEQDVGAPLKNMDFECGLFCQPEDIK